MGEEHVIVIVIRPDGVVVGVWCDEIPWQLFGAASVRRLSSVEFDQAAQEWVATDLRTGNEVARGALRRQVLDAEARHYRNLLERGEEP